MAHEREARPEALTPLSEMDDYEIAQGYVDVRGVDLLDESGAAIAAVDELLVDPAAESVRFLMVDLTDEGMRELEDDEEEA